MGFGIFKKLKDGFHKVRKFISNKIVKPAVEVIKKAKPVLEKVDLNKLREFVPPKHQSKIDKLDNFKKKAIEISEVFSPALDEKLKNKDISGVIEYAGHKFIPRLKH